MSIKLTSLFCIPSYTFFDWGFNFRSLNPNTSANDEYVKFFNLVDGKQSVEITLKIKGKKYPATINLSKQKAGRTDKSGDWSANHRLRAKSNRGLWSKAPSIPAPAPRAATNLIRDLTTNAYRWFFPRGTDGPTRVWPPGRRTRFTGYEPK